MIGLCQHLIVPNQGGTLAVEIILRWPHVHSDLPFDRGFMCPAIDACSVAVNKHIAFGVGAHRCLGSHLARMELRVVLEEWHARVPDYAIASGIELNYSQGLRQVENLKLVW